MTTKNVPLEPTEAMLRSGMVWLTNFSSANRTSRMSMLDEAWKAMCEASPPSGGEVCIGEVRENGVVWFGQNPHAHPIGTRFYTSPRVVDGVREAAERVIRAFSDYGNESNKLAGMQRHRECEESMTALQAALEAK